MNTMHKDVNLELGEVLNKELQKIQILGGIVFRDVNKKVKGKTAKCTSGASFARSSKLGSPTWVPPTSDPSAYLIIVADAADAVSVNFFGRCKFLQI